MSATRSVLSAALLAIAASASALPLPALAQDAQAPDEITFRDLSVEQQPIARLHSQRTDLKVNVWTDRKKATYTQGETATIFVEVNRDAYITILDVGTSGRTHVIFPNRLQRDNRIEAHQVLAVPGENAGFRLRVGGPPGRELIKVIASETPLQLSRAGELDEEGAFETFRHTGEALTRDLGIEMERTRETGITTANTILTILPRSNGKPHHTPTSHGEAGPDELFQRGEAAFYGEGRRAPDYAEAMKWYNAAAEAGHVQAMYRIARMHEEGRYLDRNPRLALTWYRKAADLGNTQAMVHMAMLYALGQGVEKSPAEAVRWLKRAADQNDGLAMLNLAKMHDAGTGVEKDPRLAAAYLLDGLKAGAWIVLEQAKSFSEETRREVQAALKRAGRYAGPIDGQIGSATRAAMIAVARTV